MTGGTRYAADFDVPGLLHARLVLSTEAHARIEQINLDEALRVGGVVSVLTATDLPLAEDPARMNEPLAREEVVFAGQPIAMVVAESAAAAEDGVEAVVVDYTPLDIVLDVEEAMVPGARLARVTRVGAVAAAVASAHAGVAAGAHELPEEELSENVLGRAYSSGGDVAAAFAESDVVLNGRFRTSWVYQAYLEPQVAVAWTEVDGGLVVVTSTQGPFYTRGELARLFGLPVAQVRVRAAALGGAFGGKLLIVEPLAAGAALRLGRPVRLELTRNEDFAATNPAPASIIEIRLGARQTGELTGLEARVIFDRGSNAEWGLEDTVPVLVAGPYRWRAHVIRAYGVETNRVRLGTYRAPGGPPAAFALESLLDELAAALALDPLELRLMNAVGEGDVGVDGESWPPVGVRECLEGLREHPRWKERGRLPPDEGVGIALATWPGANEPAAATCRLEPEGGLTVITGAVDMTGTESGFALIAAETFGVPLEQVTVISADTTSAPYGPISGGSKVTYAVGRAVERAAAQARERLLRVAAEELEAAAEDLELFEGTVRPVGVPERGLAVADLAKRVYDFGSKYEPVEGLGGSAQTKLAPSASAHLAHVRVDRETGSVQVVAYVVAQDVGRALNPALVEGQMRGGATQGIGWALFEELAHDERGQLVTTSFLEYAIPSADVVPEIETLIIEVPAPGGPFGARGIGEASVVPGPAAVANAIAAATAVRLRELPMTPPRVWAALHG